MPNQMFYLNNNNYEELKKLDNKSGLINSLLEDYFKKVHTPLTLKEKEKLLEKLILEQEFDKKLAEINGKG